MGIFSEGNAQRGRIAQLAKQATDTEQRYLSSAYDMLEQGFGRAFDLSDDQLKLASQQSRTARRGARDTGREQMGAFAARFGGGARSRTTAYDNAVQGISSRVTRQLADIDARFADTFSDIQGRRAGLEIQRGGALSSVLGEMGQSKAAGLRTMADIVSSKNPYQELNFWANWFDPGGFGGRMGSSGDTSTGQGLGAIGGLFGGK